MAIPSLKIAPCDYKSAKFAVLNWHYSKAMPVGKLVKFGVWENNKFVGAVIFGRGASRHVSDFFKLSQIQCVELVRVALNKHTVPVTKVISICFKLLQKSNPGLKLIYSYADQNVRHTGKIYQAGNWIYTGLSALTPVYKCPDGKTYHSRMISETGELKQFGRYVRCFKPSQCQKIEKLPKFRYAYVLDKSLLPKILRLQLPYPAPLV